MAYQFKRDPLMISEANELANAALPGFERLIVWTLLDTGLRVSELCGLRSDSLDWQQHRITVRGKGGPFGTKSKRRIVPMSDRIAPLLEAYFSIHLTFDRTPRTVERLVKTVANRARISRPVTPHVLRHTFAVTANRKGISLPALQRLLGHDRLSSTEIYLNLSPEDVAKEWRDKW